MRSIILHSAISALVFAAEGATAGAILTDAPTPAKSDVESALEKGLLPVLTDKKKVNAIHESIGGSRVLFTSIDEAVKKLEAAGSKTNSFESLPVLISDQDKFGEGCMVSVSTLGTRIKSEDGKKGSGTNGIRAILVMPVPSATQFIEQEKEWVSKLIYREAADTNYAGLRAASTVKEAEQAINAIALTPAEFVSSSNVGIDTSAFEDNWGDFRAVFLKQRPEFADHIPQKAMVLKAFRSASYAAANPYTAQFEERGFWPKIAAMFIKSLEGAVDPKTNEPLDIDTSVISGWIETRDSVNLTYSEPPKPKDIGALEL